MSQKTIFDLAERLSYDECTSARVSDVIASQLREDGTFNRMDIVIKYMCIQDMRASKKCIGWEYYRRMYESIGNRWEFRVQKFANMVDRSGVDTIRKPIQLTKQNLIWDGSHRIAASIHADDSLIGVVKTYRLVKHVSRANYRWVKSVFNDAEWSNILDSLHEITNVLSKGLRQHGKHN